jgi:hypothetical protein
MDTDNDKPETAVNVGSQHTCINQRYADSHDPHTVTVNSICPLFQ